MTEYYIWSYEHNAWWKPNSIGYTIDLRQAGRYTAEQVKVIIPNDLKREDGYPDEIAFEVPKIV